MPSGSSILSIPDRRRIDSDVRVFLREPSTPWIVFDREGRPPSQLAVGELLAVGRRSVLSLSDANFFPHAASLGADVTITVEPSSVALASDLQAEASSASWNDVTSPSRRSGKALAHQRALGVTAAAFAMLGAVGALVFANRGPSAAVPSAKVAASQATTPPAVDVAVGESSSSSPTSLAAREPTPREVQPAIHTSGKFGRLTISGDARSRDVYFDRKRLLGQGARSFTVFCGPHIIGIGSRADTREIDIPCTGNAEFVVSK